MEPDFQRFRAVLTREWVGGIWYGDDMAEMKLQWGDRLSLLGGIDLDLLSRGTVEQVIEVRRF